MDAVRKLILDRLKDTRKNMSEVSKGIGRNHAYLQQFIERGVPATLPERIRSPLAALLGIDEELLKSGTAHSATLPRNLATIARATPRPKVPLGQSLGEEIQGRDLVGADDLPVFGTAQGGQGALVITDQPVTWVVRPAPLLRVREGYGIIVSGDSMAPQFESGATALVNPHLPPRPGDTCVFRAHADDGTVIICIKKLVRFTDTIWFVKQYSPSKSFQLKRSEWQVCHPTVGNYF